MSETIEQAKHTPGPWQWFFDGKSLDLRTPHSGQLIILDHDGSLRFAQRTDRMGGLLRPGHHFAKGGEKWKRTDVGFVPHIDNPDARLIAAAPDLLAACKAQRDNNGHTDHCRTIREERRQHRGEDSCCTADCIAINAAIAKAEGRAS